MGNDLKLKDIFNSLDSNKDSFISFLSFWRALNTSGIKRHDARLQSVRTRFLALEKQAIDRINFKQFKEIVRGNTLVENALKGNLIIPNFEGFCKEITKIFKVVSKNTEGSIAQYIPELRAVNPDQFAVSLCTIDGQIFSLGDYKEYFSLQSTCKIVNYCLALERLGEDKVHQHMGREPSGGKFNTIEFQEETKLPHNPLINAGAIMSCALIASQDGYHSTKRSSWIKLVKNTWKKLAPGKNITENSEVAISEQATAWINNALANIMRGNKVFPNNPDATQLNNVLDFYFKCCAVELTPEAMSMATGTLANGGLSPVSGEKVFEPETVKNCLSIMYSCGLYDFSGEFAFKIGLPAKSGVSGALMVIIPGVMGLCIWSPRIDKVGNTIRGLEFCERLVQQYSFHIYDGLILGNHQKTNPTLQKREGKLEGITQLIYAAHFNDLAEIKRLEAAGLAIKDNPGDYDKRTPLHLAAAEGAFEVVQFLIEKGVYPNPKDRWGGTPLDDAHTGKHLKVIELLEKNGAKRGKPYRHLLKAIMAASLGDLETLKKQHERGFALDRADYDQRTPLHLAAAEGHFKVVKFLIKKAKVKPNPKDRWGNTPRQETNSKKIKDFLEKYAS